MTATCEEFALVWPELYPRPDEATNRKHASAIKPFAAHFGSRPLAGVTRPDARQWALRHPGHVRFARTLFNDAIDDQIIAGPNPFANLRLSFESPPDDVWPCVEDVEALIEAASEQDDDGRMATMIRFAAFTGLRLGEQMILEHDDLDRNGGQISVTRQLNEHGKIKAPKGGHNRSALLPDQAYPLRPNPPDPSTRIWGDVTSRHSHHRAWSKVRDAVGFTGRWHSLRHFNATWLLNLGASVDDVAIHLGNSAEEVRRTYAHPDPDLALERLRGLTT